MLIKGIIEEDFINYKKPALFISFPYCSFKCDKDFGSTICQNSALAKQKNIDIPYSVLVEKYTSNPITQAIVFGGLEPFDSFEAMMTLIWNFRKSTKDDIVIYTGYNADEIEKQINKIVLNFENIIIKFGRFIPNQNSHYDKVLGIQLASDNQCARRIS